MADLFSVMTVLPELMHHYTMKRSIMQSIWRQRSEKQKKAVDNRKELY